MLTEKISRRDLLKVAGRYGLSSTLIGAAALGGAITLPRLAEAANSTYAKRFKSEPKFTLKFGAAPIGGAVAKRNAGNSLRYLSSSPLTRTR